MTDPHIGENEPRKVCVCVCVKNSDIQGGKLVDYDIPRL